MSERRVFPRSVPISRPSRRVELTLLLAILLAAAFLRFWRLDSVPPGLTHDEANNVHDAAAVLDGVRPAYFPAAQGKEPLYSYSVAALMAFLGRSPWTMRLTSAVWGLFLIVLTFAWVRRAFTPTIALLTAAGLATSFWAVTTSRMGLRAITLPVLFAAGIYFLWRGIHLPTINTPGSQSAKGNKLILSGLFIGLSLYTYLAARLMPLVLVLFFLYFLAFHRRIRWGILSVLVIVGVVAAPLFLYLGAHPSAEIRVGQLDQPLRVLLDGDPGPLWERVRQTLLMFSFDGDTFIPYNLPGKPLLDPLMSLLFYAGLFLALRRWRRPAYALALLWLVVGFGPALITGVEAANLRAIAAQPVLYLFPALTLDALRRWLPLIPPRKRGGRPDHQSTTRDDQEFPPRKRGGRPLQGPGGAATLIAACILFTAIGSLTYRDYFLRWANDRDVRVHHHVDLVAIADYIDDDVDAHSARTFVVSALYPGQYHDPRVVEAVLGGDDDHLRWADGRWAWVFPAGADVAFIVPDAVPLDPVLASQLSPHMEKIERVTIRPDDWNPTFDVYRWMAPSASFSQPLAQFGEQLTLFDVGLPDPPLAPGDVVEILTTWRITGRLPADRDAALFVQLLGPDNTVITQQDRLDVPSWNWHPGDYFAQLFRLSLPPDLAPGTYRLITGVYTTPDRVDAVLAGHEPDPAMPRLPVLVHDQIVGDFFELPAVQVMSDE